MKLTITIDLGNAAFENSTYAEIRRICGEGIRIAQHNKFLTGNVRLVDFNGNTVGNVKVED